MKITDSMSVMDVIQHFDLIPLPEEGGYYKETYRSRLKIHADDDRGLVARVASTVIYYLITPDNFSALHRLKFDEIYHFYLGDPAEMLVLNPDGSHRTIDLGQDIENGHKVQAIVEAGEWQGTRLKEGGKWSLLGTTMAPGFDFKDFELGNYSKLIDEYPDIKGMIREFVR